MGQILVRWSLQKGQVYLGLSDQVTDIRCRYSPLPKSSQPERVKSNADLYDFVLDNDDMTALDKLDVGDLGALSWNPIHAR